MLRNKYIQATLQGRVRVLSLRNSSACKKANVSPHRKKLRIESEFLSLHMHAARDVIEIILPTMMVSWASLEPQLIPISCNEYAIIIVAAHDPHIDLFFR